MRAKFFGGDGKGDTPVPIPNTEVKTFCADGTAWEAAWESRSPPITSLHSRWYFIDEDVLFLDLSIDV